MPVRAEIQGLRAVAVLLVVVHHLWPAALPGGFVGVDVFFAISGFLITSHLVREIDRTGRVSLLAFWGRRVRRILPAALFVLLCSAAATALLVPPVYWEQFIAEIRASTLYAQNWHLASAAVDYFAAEDGPSPVRHFWSLSVEEQFYLCWPVLLLAASFGRRRMVAITIGAVTAASLVYSVRSTAANPAAAYFATPARAWEFGAGALLALAGARRFGGAPLAWAGLAAIGLAAATYAPATAVPGVAALLPVLGAVAVMASGVAVRPLALAPAQVGGDLSYSIYLWHWPLIVLVPSTTPVVILMLTILLAWLTKRLVEDPLRFGRASRPTFALVAAATVALLGVCSGGSSYLRDQIREAERASASVLSSRPACFGAAARDPQHPCENPKLRLTVVPTPLQARDRSNAPCTLEELRGLLYVCGFGTPRKHATGTIALIGDSHASHWRAAVEGVADARGWHGVSITHSGCPFTRAVKDLREPARSDCLRWNREVRAWLGRHREIETVFVSAISGSSWVVRPGRSQFASAVDGYLRAFKSLGGAVKQVVVIRDTPKAERDTAACVQRAIGAHRRAGTACAQPRSRALTADPLAAAALRWKRDRIHLADLTRLICDARKCFPVVGGALVYKDEHHLTTVYARTMTPYLQRQVDRVVAPR